MENEIKKLAKFYNTIVSDPAIYIFLYELFNEIAKKFAESLGLEKL